MATAVPPTAAVADALVRLGRVPRVGPSAVHRLLAGPPIAGPAIPCRHRGSVDVFLEAIDRAVPGGILVIDNAGRLDEGCIGDLTVGEARAAGALGIAAGIVAAGRGQSERLAAGASLRDQLGFDEYKRRRATDPTYDF